MPSYTRGKPRNITTYVKVNEQLFYGFRTKDLAAVTGVTQADITALGHVTAPPANSILCFAANAPKPPRVSKKIAGAASGAQGSVGSFCAYDRLAAAIAAGWNLAKDGLEVGLRTSGKTVTVVAEIAQNGVLYAFSMNSADFASYGDVLGLKTAQTLTASELQRVVRGSTYPKPGRAQLTLQTGGTVNAFYSPAKKLDLQQPTSGWRVQSSARLLAAPAAPVTP